MCIRDRVYSAPQDNTDVSDLYVVPIGGGTPLKLNTPLAPGGDVIYFQISPDAARVVYKADQQTDEVLSLIHI